MLLERRSLFTLVCSEVFKDNANISWSVGLKKSVSSLNVLLSLTCTCLVKSEHFFSFGPDAGVVWCRILVGEKGWPSSAQPKRRSVEDHFSVVLTLKRSPISAKKAREKLHTTSVCTCFQLCWEGTLACMEPLFLSAGNLQLSRAR